MDLIPNRTFLLKQIEQEGGKKKDVVAKKGVLQKGVTEREAIKYWGAWSLTPEQEKKLLAHSRQHKLSRVL
jgi:hypothetical protein